MFLAAGSAPVRWHRCLVVSTGPAVEIRRACLSLDSATQAAAGSAGPHADRLGAHVNLSCHQHRWVSPMYWLYLCRLSLLGFLLLGLSNVAFAHSDAAHHVSSEVTLSADAGPEEVRAELARLRAENERLRAQTRLRDVLGGLGLLAGIFGVSYYVAARRAHRQSR